MRVQSNSSKNREAILYYLGTHQTAHWVNDLVPYLEALGLEPVEQALTQKLVTDGRVELVPGHTRTYRLTVFVFPTNEVEG